MTGPGHLIIGLQTGLLVGAITGHSLTGIIVSGISALVLDVDEPRSLLARKISPLSKFIKPILILLGLLVLVYTHFNSASGLHYLLAGAVMMLGINIKETTIRQIVLTATGLVIIILGFIYVWWLILFGLYIAVAPWLAHRGLTHTVWMALYWSLIGMGISYTLDQPNLVWFAVAGYLSHMIGDSITKQGVKWLYPLINVRFRIPLMRVGTQQGMMVETIIIACLFLWISRVVELEEYLALLR